MLNLHNLKKLVRAIISTRNDEIGCEECFSKLDRFVELHLRGKDAAQAMSLVQHHLNMCPDCKEEFTALLQALQYEKFT